jgi:hypothetical protein
MAWLWDRWRGWPSSMRLLFLLVLLPGTLSLGAAALVDHPFPEIVLFASFATAAMAYATLIARSIWRRGR